MVCLGVTALIVWVFLRVVDLKPQVEEQFFFSRQDPQVRADNEILKIFPEWQQIVVLARGDIGSTGYQQRLRALSDDLADVPGVVEVTSLSRGPKDLDDALKSPLWSRLLIARDRRASYVFVSVKKPGGEESIARVEALKRRFESRGFQLSISGVPYMTELIARNLARDLRVLSLAAACIFGVLLLVVFRSGWVLLGTFAACVDSGACTLLAAHLLHIPIGPLTANLSTMVFVMTLSPIVFLSFNWKRIRGEGQVGGRPAAWTAVKRTVAPSFWSAICMFLGFLSLWLVPSTPMKHLGTAGAIGATLAFASAYLVYPWFLAMAAPASAGRETSRMDSGLRSFFSRRHGLVAAGLAVFTVIGAFGLPHLNTDPDLPSYFKQGGELRTGLELVDKTGGSSPLKFVVEEKPRVQLSDKGEYKKLLSLHEALEKDPAVGSVISLPLLLSEPNRHWYSFLFSTDREIKQLDKPEHGEIARQFVSPDRTRALFLLRMRETGRTTSRRQIIERLEKIVQRAGFRIVLVGGAYSLLDQMARLITSSIISGVLLLIGIFVLLGIALSRSIRVAGAMLVSLAIIPVVVRGYIAYLGMPLDFITASAANLDLGMGVDAMIYLTMFAKHAGKGRDPWAPWSKACSHLWRPIGTNLLVICCGFSLFLLSNFPPTQRFGLFVIFGSATAASSALFLFPWLASLSVRRKAGAEYRKAA